jgi:hypothetical protein
MRLRSVFRVAPAFISPFLACAFLFVLACSGQQEGQACSTYNGNADCANGLVCKPNLPNVNGSRCCPADPNLSTTVICGTPTDAIATDSAAPAPSDGSSPADGQVGDESAEASSTEAATDEAATSEAGNPVDDGAVPPDAGPDADTAEASADAASE